MTIWAGRLLIAAVIVWNLQAAFSFLFSPLINAISFKMEGSGSIIATQGIGLLFLMWNIPYLFAFASPVKYRTSLVEAILMQVIAISGEIILYNHQVRVSGLQIEGIQRFIYFDLAGLIFLLLALWITIFRNNWKPTK